MSPAATTPRILTTTVGSYPVPEWLVAADLRSGRLTSVLDDFLMRSEASLPGIFVVLPRRRYQAVKVTAFIDFFAEKIRLSQRD